MDNKHPNCPPLMQDARHFTDWRSNGTMTRELVYTYNLDSSSKLSGFLHHNAKRLMAVEQKKAFHSMKCVAPEHSPCQNDECGVFVANSYEKHYAPF